MTDFLLALRSNDIKIVAKLLEEGVNPHRVMDNNNELTDTLYFVIEWMAKPEIANLLLKAGAKFSSEESKRKFVKDFAFEMDYKVNSGGPFKEYLQLLDVLHSYRIIDASTIRTMVPRYREPEILTRLSLLLVPYDKSEAEVKKNMFTLAQGRSKHPFFQLIPNGIIGHIAALTADPDVHNEKDAKEVVKNTRIGKPMDSQEPMDSQDHRCHCQLQ